MSKASENGTNTETLVENTDNAKHNIFEKKEIIFSETLGVCRVAEVTNLSAKNGNQITYYGLKSVNNPDKVSYIPVEHHQVQLRRLIEKEEAERLSKLPEADQKKLTPQQIEEYTYVLAHS